MGESVEEATLTAWLVNVGDNIDLDDGIVEVATDKVDTEIPSEVSGILLEKKFEVDDVIKVGQTIAVIETDAEEAESVASSSEPATEPKSLTEDSQEIEKAAIEIESTKPQTVETSDNHIITSHSGDRFYSPLVRNIAEKEQIAQEELDQIPGTGLNGRVTKNDMFAYLEKKKSRGGITPTAEQKPKIDKTRPDKTIQKPVSTQTATQERDEIIPMDRMGKLIAEHMVHSVQTSAHVQSFIEVDVTKIVQWRNKVKDSFLKETGEKITFTPVFMHAVAQTINEYPMVNISVSGTDIIKKNNINLGMATALSDGNLIVPVIKNADELSIRGMTKAVNRLAEKARNNKLDPDDISGGTYTVTNVGSFGSITGTPIINQPQVAILALGAIRKVPAVIETAEGDVIGIRHQMIIAHSYDHRVINGALGGLFILKLKEILENFDTTQTL